MKNLLLHHKDEMIKTTNTSEIKSPATNTPAHRCLYCGMEAELIWVHGHGQCSHCGINTEECCRGESCAYK